MPYTIEILESAKEQIRALPKKIRGQIGKKIDRLASDPFPPDCTKLEAREDSVYRVRCGDYRILYTVNKGKAVVLVVKVGDRKDVYK
jgi:mRNA interferase RelE/StbE